MARREGKAHGLDLGGGLGFRSRVLVGESRMSRFLLEGEYVWTVADLRSREGVAGSALGYACSSSKVWALRRTGSKAGSSETRIFSRRVGDGRAGTGTSSRSLISDISSDSGSGSISPVRNRSACRGLWKNEGMRGLAGLTEASSDLRLSMRAT